MFWLQIGNPLGNKKSQMRAYKQPIMSYSALPSNPPPWHLHLPPPWPLHLPNMTPNATAINKLDPSNAKAKIMTAAMVKEAKKEREYAEREEEMAEDEEGEEG